MSKDEMIIWLNELRNATEDMVMVKANFKDYNKPYKMVASDLIHEVIMVLKDDQRRG